MLSKPLQYESVQFRRVDALPGVEILDASNTSRNWRVFNLAYGLAVPRTWHGEAVYRGRVRRVAPGDVFCTEPGEVHTTPCVHNAGSFSVLAIDALVFRTYAEELGVRTNELHWRRIVERMSSALATRLAHVFRVLQPTTTSMELQSSLTSAFEAS